VFQPIQYCRPFLQFVVAVWSFGIAAQRNIMIWKVRAQTVRILQGCTRYAVRREIREELMKLVAGFACGALGLFAATAQANLITNGSFDTNADGWTFNRGIGPGGDWGWRPEGNPGGSYWVNHNSLNVGSDPDPTLSQVFTTVEGQEYLLTFDYARRVIGGGNGLAVDIDGVQLATYVIFADSVWRSPSLMFTATGTSTTLAFRTEIDGTDYDAMIDTVSVLIDGGGPVPVPEPGSLALLGLGLAGLGLSRRRKAA
jgi:hypothetical protein